MIARSSKFKFIKIKLLQRNDLDKKLFFGASIFGVGWGLVGLCPGPALSSIALFQPITLIFLLAMMVGVMINKYI